MSFECAVRRSVCYFSSEVERRLGSDLNPFVLVAIAPAGISEVEGRPASLVERAIDANIQQGDEREIESHARVPDKASDVAHKATSMGEYRGAHDFQKVESSAPHDGAGTWGSRGLEGEFGFWREAHHRRREAVPEAKRYGGAHGVERVIVPQITHDDICPHLRGDCEAVIGPGLTWNESENEGRSIDEKHLAC